MCTAPWSVHTPSITHSLARSLATQILNLSFNSITAIPPNSFVGLSDIGWLKINDNQITAIYNTSLTGFTSPFFTVLEMQNNHITFVESGSFASMSALKSLVLLNNRLAVLHAGTFTGLTTLDVLVLESNPITDIELGAFAGLTSMSVLRLAHTQLSTLRNRVFADCEQLGVLELYNTTLSVIGVETFAGLGRLTALQMGDCMITSIADQAFVDLTALSVLALTNNRITFVGDDALVGLRSLTTLDLIQNNVTIITDRAFDGLTNLVTLKIVGNRLTSYSSLQNPDLVKLGDCTSTLVWWPQIVSGFGAERCVVNTGPCPVTGDICASRATCLSTYGPLSGCCSSSLGACRACAANASVLPLRVCVQCEECAIVNGQAAGGPPGVGDVANNFAPYFNVTSSSPTGSCQLDFGNEAGGLCFTDGPGNYAASERCTISVLRPGVLTVDLVTNIGREPCVAPSPFPKRSRCGVSVSLCCAHMIAMMLAKSLCKQT